MGQPGTKADAHGHGDLHNADVHHETTDIDVRGIIWFIVVLTTTVVVTEGAMWGLFKVYDKIEVSSDPFVSPLAVAPAKAGQDFPAPGLQTTPWQDLKQFRSAEELHLQTYGWVDQKSGVARLPIEKAKALLLQRGLPSRAGESDPTEGTHVAATGESNSGRLIPAGQADASVPPSAAPAPANAPAPATRVSATPQSKKPGGGI